MAMKAIHQHPLDATEPMEGRALELEEVIKKGAVYADSISKKWLPVPPIFIGTPVQEAAVGKIVYPFSRPQQ